MPNTTIIQYFIKIMKKTFLMPMAGVMMSAIVACSFTACSDDDTDDSLEIAEKFNMTGLVAAAQNDGTIVISGTVETNKKLKTFTLTSEDGSKTYDLLEGSEAEKDRTEDGKVWTCTLSSPKIPVGIYTMQVRTRMGTTKETKIGKEYSFLAGTGANKSYGSYMSLKRQTSYFMQDGDGVIGLLDEDGNVKEECKDVEIALNADLTLKSAKEVKNKVIAENAANANIYAESHCVITETGCIATYEIIPDADDETLCTIKGVVLTSNDEDLIKVDVNGEVW